MPGYSERSSREAECRQALPLSDRRILLAEDSLLNRTLYVAAIERAAS